MNVQISGLLTLTQPRHTLTRGKHIQIQAHKHTRYIQSETRSLGGLLLSMQYPQRTQSKFHYIGTPLESALHIIITTTFSEVCICALFFKLLPVFERPKQAQSWQVVTSRAKQKGSSLRHMLLQPGEKKREHNSCNQADRNEYLKSCKKIVHVINLLLNLLEYVACMTHGFSHRIACCSHGIYSQTPT